MAQSVTPNLREKSLSVFMIGNNPIDISNIYEKLKASSKIKFVTEAAFDITGMFRKIIQLNPNYILLDDNLGSSKVRRIIHQLVKDKRTHNIPITIVKNSNYSAVITEGAQDYILKDTLNEDSVYRSFVNSRKLRKTQVYFYKSLRKNKQRFEKLMNIVKSNLSF